MSVIGSLSIGEGLGTEKSLLNFEPTPDIIASMPHELKVTTRKRCELVEITDAVRRTVRESGLRDGMVVVYIPHTTAGVTIQENADPDVVRDVLMELERIVPFEDGYLHAEGNSAAHLKSSLFGSSVTVLVEDGDLLLGTWQGIYFCEFDGPRNRKVWLKTSGDGLA
jgi:secondary thiamine-phosphate synthase enzyme